MFADVFPKSCSLVPTTYVFKTYAEDLSDLVPEIPTNNQGNGIPRTPKSMSIDKHEKIHVLQILGHVVYRRKTTTLWDSPRPLTYLEKNKHRHLSSPDIQSSGDIS